MPSIPGGLQQRWVALERQTISTRGITQVWLAASDDPAATVSGRYWHHRRTSTAAKEASDNRFQDELLAKLAELTGVSLQ